MKLSENTPWLLVGGDLRKDAPYFVPLGFLVAVLQVVGYGYFNKANWGETLLLEHLAFHSTAFSILFLWGGRLLLIWQGKRRGMAYLDAMITNVANRAVGFASVAACVIFGFAIVPGISGAFWHAGMFMLCSFYFVCLAEVAANPLLGKGDSKAHPIALGVIIGMPFALSRIAF
ncbi:hypothetical protein [Shinella zoogloeoides]|uniref:Uncharacterized protein n=1 Tax=Shinella zoogloeoides TaxID=352475 RepID=A0A6N8T936_SHIZO|nr:hypothetical protein [Shinella zoogloeoides]MXN99478.1 hypothetical protein [Shinella zoogloeoides]UEX82745.1 hypothetical protein K8M09_05555 [Shinella zoogloeoides]